MEKIYHLQKEDISPLIKELDFKNDDYMILERVDKIFFKYFKETDFEDWERGCIFCSNREIKWRQIDGNFNVVYSGEDITLNSSDDFICANAFDDSVVLWGQRSPEMTDFGPNEYIELPIPRVLSYPITSSYRIKLELKILKDNKGEIIGSRFTGLKEEEKQ